MKTVLAATGVALSLLAGGVANAASTFNQRLQHAC